MTPQAGPADHRQPLTIEIVGTDGTSETFVASGYHVADGHLYLHPATLAVAPRPIPLDDIYTWIVLVPPLAAGARPATRAAA